MGSYVAEAYRLAFPASWKADRLVATFLTGYFDESGTHNGAPCVSVAGYVSTVEGWELFEKEWRETLAEWGIEFFHMTDFAQGQKQFKGWSESEKLPRVNRLTDIINAHALASFGVVIPQGAYDARRAASDRTSSLLIAVYLDLSEATRLVSSPMMIALAASPDSSSLTPTAAPIRG